MVNKTQYNDFIKTFKDLGIKENQYPKYENPYDFAKKFKKCSILKPVEIISTNKCC